MEFINLFTRALWLKILIDLGAIIVFAVVFESSLGWLPIALLSLIFEGFPLFLIWTAVFTISISAFKKIQQSNRAIFWLVMILNFLVWLVKSTRELKNLIVGGWDNLLDLDFKSLILSIISTLFFAYYFRRSKAP